MIDYSTAVFEFIQLHRQEKAAAVALALSKKPELPKEFILNQINGYQKATKKLPFLKNHPSYQFPNSRAVSQSSSETTAQFKASLISGNKLLDASGGMGIDSYFFSKVVNRVVYLEPNTELFDISCKNFERLNTDNIEGYNKTAIDFLASTKVHFDWIYLDPDRRKNSSRLVRIEDCEPNVIALVEDIWQHTSRVMLKLSPMLDISVALRQLAHCQHVYIVAVDNECKELLFDLKKDYLDEPEIHAINIEKNRTASHSFKYAQEQSTEHSFSNPLRYLYEPNASILKAGGFKSIVKAFGLKKIAPSTHLYTSDHPNYDFPGRILKIEGVYKPKKGVVKIANVVCRNFPLKPDAIKKKYKIADGGNNFVYACTLNNKEKVFIVAEKITT